MANLYFLRYENMDKKTKNLGHKLIISWVWAILWLTCAFLMFPIWSTSAGLLDFFEKSWEPKKGDFKWEDITICDRDWKECFTFMDRNLWAETNDIKDEKSYWYKFQWWNNYGFTADGLKTTNKQWNTAEYWPKNPYSSSEFVVWNWNWSADWNSNLRWWEWDSEKNKRWLDVNYESRQGPCPDWYHVPSAWEITRALDIWTKSLNIKSSKNIQWLSSIAWKRYVYELWNHFNIPFAGRLNINGELVWVWKFGYLWLSSPSDEYANLLYINTNGVVKVLDYFRGDGYPVRCFKNVADTPNKNDWEDITICNPDNSDECITMMDRNLWATTAYKECKDKYQCEEHSKECVEKYTKDNRAKCVEEHSEDECKDIVGKAASDYCADMVDEYYQWWQYYWIFDDQDTCDMANKELKQQCEENNKNSYWYHYQWWNNHGFASCLEEWCDDFPWKETTTTKQVESATAPYSSNVFVLWYDNWLAKANNDLWWWGQDSDENWRWAKVAYSKKDSIKDETSSRQWPCPDWYHVPSAWEWSNLVEIWAKNNKISASYYIDWLSAVDNNSDMFRAYFKIPLAGARFSNWIIWKNGNESRLRSSSSIGEEAKHLYISSTKIMNAWESNGSALSVRCFKDQEAVSDKDGDGIADKLDKCPNTPDWYKVDETGCSKVDTDGDWVIDDLDQCPWTKEWTPVTYYGCPDSDGDGVIDEKDECPGTPKWAKVSEKGCPLDTDGDWIYDGFDQCEGTPRGVDVDDIWCSDVDWDWIFDDYDKCPDTPKWYDINDVWCPDLDWDGLFDNEDTCPKTPDWYKVDKTGCSSIDTDEDGIIDDLDNCPDTPKDTTVDTEGCPKK